MENNYSNWNFRGIIQKINDLNIAQIYKRQVSHSESQKKIQSGSTKMNTLE